MKIRMSKNSIVEFLEYSYMLVIILQCRSVWMNILTTRKWFGNVLLFLLVFIVFVLLFAKKNFNMRQCTKSIQWVIFLSIYVLVFAMMNSNNLVSLLKLMIVIAVVIVMFCIVIEKNDVEKLWRKYENIMCFISITSFLFWMIGPILSIISPTGLVYNNWNGTGIDALKPNYYGVYFLMQTQRIGAYTIYRNTAFFNESPMYSLHLSMALLIELFISNKKSRIKQVILIVGIISTFSFLGYILLMFAYAFYYIFNKPGRKNTYYIKAIMLPVFIAAVLCAVFFLVSEKMGTSSGSIRIDDFKVGFRVWKDYPIFGGGYGNNDILKEYMGAWRAHNTGFSNSIMQIFVGGILYIMIFTRGFYRATKNRNKNMLFDILFFFLFIFTIISYTYLTLSVMAFMSFYGYNENTVSYSISSTSSLRDT